MLIDLEHLGYFWHFGGGLDSTAESSRAWSTSLVKEIVVTVAAGEYSELLSGCLDSELGGVIGLVAVEIEGVFVTGRLVVEVMFKFVIIF